MNDLKFVLGQLLKNPGFTAVACLCGARRQAVLTLVLGSGATTAVLTIVNAVTLASPLEKSPGELVWMFSDHDASFANSGTANILHHPI